MNNNDLYKIAEDNQIIIERMNLQKNKSLSVRIRNRDFIGLDEDAIENSAEERTHLAHELGHCATGAFYEVGSPLQVRGQAEHRANKWAVLHCVPKQELITLLKQGLQKWELAEHFNVTEDLINTAVTFYFDYGIAV